MSIIEPSPRPSPTPEREAGPAFAAPHFECADFARPRKGVRPRIGTGAAGASTASRAGTQGGPETRAAMPC